MVITHNVSALNTYKALGAAGGATNKSMEKLSSGYRINRAGDDAAGLSISEKMRSQIRGLNQATTNAENGVSMIQTAEGALNETHSILQRIRELAVQSATDTNATEDREALQSEVAQLIQEVDRISDTTEFNGMKVLDGTKTDVKFHVGANKDQVISVSFGDVGSDKLGIYAATPGVSPVDGKALKDISITSRTGANDALDVIDAAIKQVSKERSTYGAIQNRLEYTINNLKTTAENMTSAESTIRDVDMAKEMMEYTKNNILQQAAQAMLVQANARPQQALQLLQ
ncbi:MAG: flagellin Hag [Clostridia bacterium]|nr:flagellin Hag [Clostridia bacterium]